MSKYAERDICELDRAGSYYCNHVVAMTKEGLHSKADIAAELGYRDMLIDSLVEALEELLCQTRQYGHKPEIKMAEAALRKARGETE